MGSFELRIERQTPKMPFPSLFRGFKEKSLRKRPNSANSTSVPDDQRTHRQSVSEPLPPPKTPLSDGSSHIMTASSTLKTQTRPSTTSQLPGGEEIADAKNDKTLTLPLSLLPTNCYGEAYNGMSQEPTTARDVVNRDQVVFETNIVLPQNGFFFYPLRPTPHSYYVGLVQRAEFRSPEVANQTPSP
jgi:hypothetical protein